MDAVRPVRDARAAPALAPVEDYLAELHERVAGLTAGKPADYIPELGKVDPSLFGIALATIDGEVYAAGDANHPFTIQSVSKPFMYGYALQRYGRDYVLRRVIRRAVQQGVSIGLEKPFLAGLAGQVVDEMGGAYPQLIAARSEIERVVSGEETRFRRTLDQGMGIIEEALRRARSAGSELPAEVAFELHDTYGFPFDLTRDIAAESDMSVDEERFEHLMEEQRQRARAAQKSAGSAEADELNDFQRHHADLPVAFVGYERLEVFTVIRAIQ